MKRILTISLILICSFNLLAQKKFLFDATKAETAGNADWIICATNGSVPRLPTPDQSTVTASTPENYWTGALSAWGVDLVKLGHHIESLPSGTAITYGTAAVQDLKNYDVYIVDEPNIQYTAAEKTAIINFVYNGGGLFLISDHNNSDRNSDGWDSPKIWNDLMTTNTVKVNPFGISVDLSSFSETSTNVLKNSPNDPIMNGPNGSVANVMWSSGTSFTLDPVANPSVKGVIWKNSAAQGNTLVLCGYATYGQGRVVFIGDSSPADDGTGQAGKSLYTGWTGEANGDHRRFHLNGSLWLAKVTGVTSVESDNNIPLTFSLKQNYPNPFNPSTKISFDLKSNEFVTLKIYDILGNQVAELANGMMNTGMHEVSFDASKLSSGVYVYRLTAGSFSDSKKMTIMK